MLAIHARRTSSKSLPILLAGLEINMLSAFPDEHAYSVRGVAIEVSLISAPSAALVNYREGRSRDLRQDGVTLSEESVSGTCTFFLFR
jgi:hypothetical protein